MSWSDFLVVLPCMKDSHRANNWLDGDTTLLFFLTPAGSHQLNGNARVQLLPPLPRKSNGRLGLLSPNLSGVPCNFSFLTSRYKYRGFDQRFILIQLLYTYLLSLLWSALLKRSAPVCYQTSTFEWFASFVRSIGCGGPVPPSLPPLGWSHTSVLQKFGRTLLLQPQISISFGLGLDSF